MATLSKKLSEKMRNSKANNQESTEDNSISPNSHKIFEPTKQNTTVDELAQEGLKDSSKDKKKIRKTPNDNENVHENQPVNENSGKIDKDVAKEMDVDDEESESEQDEDVEGKELITYENGVGKTLKMYVTYELSTNLIYN